MIFNKIKEKRLSGSLLDLLSVSIPLVMSLVTGAVMVIVDRLFLAHYSTEAMTGSVSANMPIWTVQLSVITLLSIAQVFVAQYQGAGDKKRMSAPAWQMIWVSLAFSIFCVVFGLFGDRILFLNSPVRAHALEYFRWLMCFSCFPLISACLSAFFVGQKKTHVIFTSSIIGNAFNILLNAPLIFGIEGVIEPMGAAGAAIATVIGCFIQLIYLLFIFFSKKNRLEHNTSTPTWEPELLKKCLLIGYPTALDRMISIGGWAIFIELISGLGAVTLSVLTITQSMMLFFTFVSQGIGRAVSSIAANAIGAKDFTAIKRVALSAVTLNALIFVLNGAFFLVYPEKFANLFLPEHVRNESSAQIVTLVVQSCFWLWIATFVDSLRWIAMGMLTAVGDTLFMMWIGSTTVWLLCIFPTYYFVAFLDMPVSYSWLFSAGYYFIITSLYTWRFKQEKWKKRLLISS